MPAISRYLTSTAQPSQSKPGPRLAIVAGALAVTRSRTGTYDTTGVGEKETALSLWTRRRSRGQTAGMLCAGDCTGELCA